MRTELQARAAWVRANWPVPEWGWDALADEEKAAWMSDGWHGGPQDFRPREACAVIDPQDLAEVERLRALLGVEIYTDHLSNALAAFARGEGGICQKHRAPTHLCCAAGSARPTCERLADEMPDIKCPCGRNGGAA